MTLPPGWERVRFQDLGTWYGGATPSKSRPEFWTNGDVPWLSPKDMGPDVLNRTRDFITSLGVDESPVRRVPSGSIAVVVRSGILERTIPVGLVPFETTLNQDMKAVTPRRNIDAKWIAWGLRSMERDLLNHARKAGTTVASIEMPRFFSHYLPVPPLGEQVRILEILEDHLSRLDAANGLTQTAEERLHAWQRGLLDLFVRDDADDELRLGSLIEHVETGRSFGGATSPATPDEWGIIRVSAMTWGEFRQGENKAVPADRVDPRYEIRAGDLLVSRANTTAYVGAPVLVEKTRPRLLLSDKSLRLVPKSGIDARWLEAVLAAPSTRRQISALATGTKDSMRNISQQNLLSVRVPHATPEQQERVAARVSVMRSSGRHLGDQLIVARARSLALHRALLTAAFSGRLSRRSVDAEMIEEMAGV